MENIRVFEITEEIYRKANPGLAYKWDNTGFQIGDQSQTVKKILLTLDVTKGAIKKAVKEDIDLIISHHPKIFKPLKRVTNPDIIKLIKNDINVLCAHTNLDVISEGVNAALAERLNIKKTTFIDTETGSSLFLVSVYVPEKELEKLKRAVFSAGAGEIGKYMNCSAEYPVKGQYTPKEGSKPIYGEYGKLERIDEIKLEFHVDSFNLPKVINAMLKAHPYDTPVYSVNSQSNKSINFGLGLIGEIDDKITLRNFAEFVKSKLNAPFLKLWTAEKKEDYQIKKVALCGGNGSSLMPKVIGKADVFVSSDFTYHSFLDSPMPLIDAGHFFTENPVLQNMKKMLKKFPLEIIEYQAEEHEIQNLRMI